MEFERLTDRQFERFQAFIYQQSGIRVDQKKTTLLGNRIRRRLQAGKFNDFDGYYRYLTSDQGADEVEEFLDAITTNETFFFRTRKHFDWLSGAFLNDLVSQYRAGRRKASLRIWSAGCASGAEPYSIAICLAENRYRLRDWELRVLGTDISQEMLELSRQAVYKSRAVEGVNDKQRRRFFRHQEASDTWSVRDEIKQLVEFKKHNLMSKSAETPFDCIFVRNVLIYFDRESKRVVLDQLLDKLAPGGFLAVGPSEGIFDMLGPLHRVSPLLYQKVEPSAAGKTINHGG